MRKTAGKAIPLTRPADTHSMNGMVGRVTPCALLVWAFDPNGAHGVTRPATAPSLAH